MSLARVAREVVAQLPGAALSAGSRWVTADGPETIRGLLVSVQPDGRYELELHLIVAWPPPPLTLLAGDLRRRVHGAAQSAGLEAQLGQMQIYFDAVLGPDDPPAGGEPA